MGPPAVAVTATVLAGLLLGPVVAAEPVPARAGSSTSTTSIELNPYDRRMVALVNAARTDAGRPALRLIASATVTARNWSERMADRGVLSHDPALVTSMTRHGCTTWRWLGENVGTTPAGPVGLFAAYMASAAHRANILDRDFSQVGVATVTRLGRRWNTLRFAAGCPR